MTPKRTMGVLGYKFGDPMKCMTGLIRDGAGGRGESVREEAKDSQVKRDGAPAVREKQMRQDHEMPAKKRSFEEVMGHPAGRV